MEKQKIQFKDLSAWLKATIIFVWVMAGFIALEILIAFVWAIIGYE